MAAREARDDFFKTDDELSLRLECHNIIFVVWKKMSFNKTVWSKCDIEQSFENATVGGIMSMYAQLYFNTFSSPH